MKLENIGKFISELRKEKGLTQEELASILGVTNRCISNWERGIRVPDISLFKSICEVFDISVNELLIGKRLNNNEIKNNTDNILISILNRVKRIKNSVSIGIIILILVIILSFIVLVNKIYPSVDIYSIVGSINTDSEDEFILNKEFTYDNRNIYYYGLKNIQVCNSKSKCYDIKSALINRQIKLKDLENYLNKQYNLGNMEYNILYDGGTKIYTSDRYSVILCNTLNNNKDIYIGVNNIIEDLDGNYCGKESNNIKSFKRTYYIESAKVYDSEFNEYTLVNDDISEEVILNNTNELLVGNSYTFTLTTNQVFEDTISNIFKYSTILKIEVSSDNINEDIIINDLDMTSIKGVSMSVSSVTNSGLTLEIIDLNSDKYTFGSEYYIERNDGNEYTLLNSVCENCAFNSIGYQVDINNKLVMNINFESMYGKLDKGKYRLVKSVCVSDLCDTIEEIYVDFSIE